MIFNLMTKISPCWGFSGGSVIRICLLLIQKTLKGGSVSGLGRSLGEWNGYPLQYSCLETPIDRGSWQATVHGVTKEGDMI